MNARPIQTGGSDGRTALYAGLVYTVAVFAVAFMVGAIRVTLLAPRVGDLVAVLLEAPIVLAVSWRFSQSFIRRFRVNPDTVSRLQMGSIAFASLMVLELGVSVLAFGETVGHYFARLGSIPGIVGLATQLCFAAIPWVQNVFRHVRS